MTTPTDTNYDNDNDNIKSHVQTHVQAHVQTAHAEIAKTPKFFKAAIPHEIVHGFIKKIAYKMPNSENHYLVDLNAYKKAVYCSDPQSVSFLHQFCKDLLPFYCKEKQIFITRKMSYNNMNTILRQVCRHCAIECKSERKYDKSKTQIVYCIVLNELNEED